jgi:hypothetical protein
VLYFVFSIKGALFSTLLLMDQGTLALALDETLKRGQRKKPFMDVYGLPYSISWTVIPGGKFSRSSSTR